MADRPIIFSAPMVRALLDGRKTQTRRVLKMAGRAPDYIGPRGCQDDPTCWGWEMPDGYFVTVEGEEKDHAPGWRNGWRGWAGAYAPGDRLWVREAHKLIDRHCDYRADWPEAAQRPFRWRPSIHMPRWASRITLTVTDVWVQRLQEISEADAVAEGIEKYSGPDQDGAGNPRAFKDYYKNAAPGFWLHPRASFGSLWNSLHGPDAWDANPWVVALTFTVQRGNIDMLGDK